MRVLVATHETQGYRDSDFCYCREGELVIYIPANMVAPEDIDGPTGSQRGLVGLESTWGTTTFKVVEMDISVSDLQAIIAAFCLKEFTPTSPDELEEAQRWAGVMVNEIDRLTNTFPLGAVLEQRGKKIQVRDKNTSPWISTIFSNPKGGRA